MAKCYREIGLFGFLATMLLAGQLRAEEIGDDEIEKPILRLSAIDFQWENDWLLGGGNDLHYTNGIKLQVSIDDYRFARFLEDKGIDQSELMMVVAHTMYTPDDTSLKLRIEDDRPYVSTLYGGLRLKMVPNADRHLRGMHDVEGLIGVRGPSAYGEEVQNFVHVVTGSSVAEGWDNQLEDALFLSLSYNYRQEILTDEERFRVVANVGALTGTDVTYANAGILINVRLLGRLLDEYFNVEFIRPTQAKEPMPKWNLNLNIGVDGRYVVDNNFVDGDGLQAIETTNWVADAFAGLELHYKKSWSTGVTYVYRTPEFEGGEAHPFGAIFLRKRF